MLFNSYDYLFFLPVVFVIYYLIPKASWRIWFLLVASYYFYMSWNPIYILLIVFSTILDYSIGLLMAKSKASSRRNLLLVLSLAGNLGILFYFKYYNFICDNLSGLLSIVDPDLSFKQHSWLLPVGISFYTFQTLSYTIDVFKKKIEPERNFFRFALYVSFFPQLVAGPVERFGNLNPQFKVLQKFNYENLSNGFKLILIGLFKKIVVADKLAIYVDQVYSDPSAYSGGPIIVASIFFVFQLYCDFSGYSDVAIGSARVLGYNLMDNFKGPLFSQNISEFWRRWHISLSTWIRDYLFNPMSMYFRHAGKHIATFVTLFTFLLFGLWHGANNTFLLFGLLHGLAIVYDTYSRKVRKKMKKNFKIPFLYSALSIALTFTFWTFTCLVFRANNLDDVFLLITNMVDFSNSQPINFYNTVYEKLEFQLSIILIMTILLLHYVEYRYDTIQFFSSKPIAVRWSLYLILAVSIPILGTYGEYKQFIYFQF